MFGKLLPQTIDFFAFFENHIMLVLKAAQSLLEMFKSNNQQVFEYAQEIELLEKEADRITHSCVESLHKTFITPIERNDIYCLIAGMDDILDAIEDVAARVLLYNLHIVKEKMIELAELLIIVIEDIQIIVTSLRQKTDIAVVAPNFSRIHKIENEANLIFRHALRTLFDEEKDPFLLIKWKEIFENIEATFNLCEGVANIVEGIMIESS
jgi:hypothetical protein